MNMRLKIEDMAGVVDKRMRVICKWLGSQFPQVKGARTLKIRRSRKSRYYGHCYGSWADVWIDWEKKEYPYTVADHRFESANCWKENYPVNNVYELFVSIAGHELAHMQRAGKRMRKSRREAFCNRRGKELVELFRNENILDAAENQANSLYEEIDQKIKEDEKAKSWKASPQGMVETLEQRKKVWMSKLKRAQNAIKKIDRKIKYNQKKLDHSMSSC
jgi:hypothetical protein